MSTQPQSSCRIMHFTKNTSAFGQQIEHLFLIVLSLWMVILTFCLIESKENIFMDEALSYRRACATLPDSDYEFYQTQDDPAEFFQHFFSVNEPFQYDAVYRNEAVNVHPPLYYYLLHTICSLFPGHFSLLFAGVINAGFAVGTLWALYGILRLLIASRKVRAVLCLLYTLSPGVWNNLSYLRMYVMLGFWVTALTWLFLVALKGQIRFYRLRLFLCVYCGILTHHHFLLFLAASSLTYLIILILRKDRATIFRYICIILSSSICALISFPPMIAQILHSDRGQEAQQNILAWREYLPRIRLFLQYSGMDLFGSAHRIVFFLFLICVIIVLWDFFRKGNQLAEYSPSALCILVLPIFFYFAAVSISASFTSTRYLYAIYPLLLIIFWLFLYYAILVLLPAHCIAVPILFFAATLLTTAAFRCASFPYLYRGDAAKRESLLPYSETDCLYLVQAENMYVDYFTDYMELSMYGSATVVNAFDTGSPASAFSDREQLVLVTDEGYFYQSNNLQAEIMDFCIRNGLPSHIMDLGKFSSETHTYICSREEKQAE